MFYVLLIFLFVFSSFRGNAGEKSLGEVTVHPPDEREGEEATHDTSSFSAVITSKELKGRRTNLSEALQEKAGVEIRRYGGLDDFATVSIRGSTSEQVAVYLDGILLNQGAGGGVNVATIPVDQIERVEIYKGSAPASFGSSSIGGVVNIITKKKGTGRETKVAQSFGSFKTYEGTIVHGQRTDRLSYQLGYTFSRSSGDFSFVDNNGTPFNDSDDRVTERRNNAFARHNLLTGFEKSLASFGSVSIGLQNQFFREDRGVPGLATLTSDTANLATTRNGTSLEIAKRELLPKFDLSLRPSFQVMKVEFRDPKGEIGLGVKDTNDLTLQYGSSLRGNLLMGNYQRWNLTLEYRGEQFQFKKIRNGGSVSLEDEIVLLSERVVINPGVRSEHIVNDFDQSTSLHPVSGKIGIKYRPVKWWGGLTLKGNFSRSYRIPNFTELFGDQGSLIGNQSLRPEKGLNGDAGIVLDFNKAPRVEVSWFRNEIDDLIQFLQTSQFTVQAQNLARGRIQGVETSIGLPLFDHLSLSGNYTFQLARDASGLPGLEGKFLPGRPIHEASGRLTLHNRHGKVFADLNFLDSNFLDTQNILRVDHRVMLGAGGSVQFLKRFTAGLEAKNLLNDLVADVVGFPLPGRSFYGKLEINI